MDETKIDVRADDEPRLVREKRDRIRREELRGAFGLRRVRLGESAILESNPSDVRRWVAYVGSQAERTIPIEAGDSGWRIEHDESLSRVRVGCRRGPYDLPTHANLVTLVLRGHAPPDQWVTLAGSGPWTTALLGRPDVWSIAMTALDPGVRRVARAPILAYVLSGSGRLHVGTDKALVTDSLSTGDVLALDDGCPWRVETDEEPIVIVVFSTEAP